MRLIRLCIVLGLLLGSMGNSARADINIFIKLLFKIFSFHRVPSPRYVSNEQKPAEHLNLYR